MAGAPIYSGDAVVVVVVVAVVVAVVVTISPQHKSDVYTLLSQVTLVLGRATGIPRVSC